MITREELREAAREFQLDVNVVEKDFVLGWMLGGIAGHPALRDAWVFKGGTCLKKCWFETYRFSEDLDFTLRDETHLDVGFLARTFDEIGDWIYEQSGIELPRDARLFEVFANSRGKRAGQGRVGYRGPNARAGGAPRIKLDLAADEVLVLEPVGREIHHPYSDRPAAGMRVLCYAYEEVFAEKLRALTERQRPRDLYDVIHLHRRLDLGPDRQALRTTLARKCEFKGIAVPTMASLSGRPERQAIESEWNQMLGHQLPACPPFADFWSELPRVFDWLHEAEPEPALPGIGPGVRQPVATIDAGWTAPPMAMRWGYAIPLEVIRFAGANRLLVEIDYETERGERSARTIEPYALRRTQSGDVLLFAVRRDTGATRSYRVDRIRGVRVLRQSYRPRFAIELTAGGSLPQLLATPAPSFSRRGLSRKTGQ